MTFFLEVLVGGLLAGVMYTMVALGFVLIHKASGVFNFAQGAMVLFAALTFVTLTERGVPFAWAFAVSLAIMLVLAVAIERIVLIACGTSYHAAIVGRFMIERLTGIPAEVDLGSEFRYRDAPIGPGTLVVAVSQSGETADTLGAVKASRAKGAPIVGITNVVGSALAREATGVLYTEARSSWKLQILGSGKPREGKIVGDNATARYNVITRSDDGFVVLRGGHQHAR